MSDLHCVRIMGLKDQINLALTHSLPSVILSLVVVKKSLRKIQKRIRDRKKAEITSYTQTIKKILTEILSFYAK